MGDPDRSGGVAVTVVPIPLAVDPDYGRPADWAVGAIGVRYSSVSDRTETEVFIRNGERPQDELDTIANAIHWVRDRYPETLITYNGEYTDIPILKRRAAVSARETPDSHSRIPDSLGILLDHVRHTDLFQHVADTAGYPPLRDVLKDRIGTAPAPVTIHGDKVTEQDVPRLALSIIEGEADRAERTALKEHVVRHTCPLFELRGTIEDSTAAAHSRA